MSDLRVVHIMPQTGVQYVKHQSCTYYNTNRSIICQTDSASGESGVEWTLMMSAAICVFSFSFKVASDQGQSGGSRFAKPFTDKNQIISHREAVFHSRFARNSRTAGAFHSPQGNFTPQWKANMANDTPKIGCGAKKSQKIKKSLPKQVDKPGLLC